MRPEYREDAEALAEEVAGDDKSTDVNVVMEAAADLKSTLELILVPDNLSQERKIRRQIKNYVFFLRAQAYRRLGPMAKGRVALADAERARDAEPLLSWQGQSALLDHALSAFSAAAGSRGGADHDRPEGVCMPDSPLILAESRAAIARMQGHNGTNQVLLAKRKRPVNDQLKKARQRVNWATGTLEWVRKFLCLRRQ